MCSVTLLIELVCIRVDAHKFYLVM